MPALTVPQCLVLKSAVLSSLRPKLEARISPKQLLSMIFVGTRRFPVEEPSSTSCPWLCWTCCRPRPVLWSVATWDRSEFSELVIRLPVRSLDGC